MHHSFQKRFARLELLLDEYETEVKKISFNEANHIPENGGWSIAQVVFHICVVEKGIIQYIQKKLADPAEKKQAGLRSFYRATLLRYALRSKRKFRAPKVLDTPQGPYDVTELINDWRKTRNDLRTLFDSIQPADVNRQLFKHPIVGKINLKQTLGFMGDHMQRHLEQIRSLKNINKISG